MAVFAFGWRNGINGGGASAWPVMASIQCVINNGSGKVTETEWQALIAWQ